MAYRAMKRVIDFLVSLTALIALFPLFIWIAWKIKKDSEGPAIFTQIRVGKNQKKFVFYKFRTMVQDAEKQFRKVKHLNEADGPVFKIAADPRLTSFGKWLREKNLDELPQLWNVLKGDMSLVGFRPPVPSEVKKYKKWQLRRFEGKPGITSLWAVKGGHKISFDNWIKMDLWYEKNASIWLDFKILSATIKDTGFRIRAKKHNLNYYPESDIKISRKALSSISEE